MHIFKQKSPDISDVPKKRRSSRKRKLVKQPTPLPQPQTSGRKSTQGKAPRKQLATVAMPRKFKKNVWNAIHDDVSPVLKLIVM